MIVSITKFGYTFQASTDDLQQGLFELETIAKIPNRCPACGAALELYHDIREAKSGKNVGKKFPYYGVQCKNRNVKHSANFGKNNDGVGTGYYFKNKWQAYYYDTGTIEMLGTPKEIRDAKLAAKAQ